MPAPLLVSPCSVDGEDAVALRARRDSHNPAMAAPALTAEMPSWTVWIVAVMGSAMLRASGRQDEG